MTYIKYKLLSTDSSKQISCSLSPKYVTVYFTKDLVYQNSNILWRRYRQDEASSFFWMWVVIPQFKRFGLKVFMAIMTINFCKEDKNRHSVSKSTPLKIPNLETPCFADLLAYLRPNLHFNTEHNMKGNFLKIVIKTSWWTSLTIKSL